MMLFQKIVVIGVLSGFVAIPVQAGPSEETLHLARAFVGNCGQNAGRIDRVESFANAMGHQKLEGDLKEMLAPQDPNIEYLGWLVKEEDFAPYLLGISEGPVDGVILSNCVIANPNISMEDVLAAVQELVEFGPQLDSFESAGQRYRVWSTNSIAEGSFVAVLDAPAMGLIGGAMTLSARKEE